MSTRATYKFINQNALQEEQTFYIHHDGYPEGAIMYFFNMLDEDNQCGGLASRFFRANDRAEPTKNHKYHGDTEFCYTLTNKGQSGWDIYVEEVYWEDGERSFKGLYRGKFSNWINGISQKASVEWPHVIDLCPGLHTINSLKKKMSLDYHKYLTQLENGQRGNASFTKTDLENKEKKIIQYNIQKELKKEKVA